jgi:hypothetical protein
MCLRDTGNAQRRNKTRAKCDHHQLDKPDERGLGSAQEPWLGSVAYFVAEQHCHDMTGQAKLLPHILKLRRRSEGSSWIHLTHMSARVHVRTEVVSELKLCRVFDVVASG